MNGGEYPRVKGLEIKKAPGNGVGARFRRNIQNLHEGGGVKHEL